MQDPVITYQAISCCPPDGPRDGLTRPALMTGILVLFLISLSCKKHLYQDKPLDSKLVVLADITAGEFLKIPVSKSVMVGRGGIIAFEKVSRAKVTVTEEGNSPWILNLNTSSGFSANPATVYTSPRRPGYEKTYSLKVEDPDLGIATAQTAIPAPVRISGFDTSGDIRTGTPVLKCRFTLVDPPTTNNFYIFEGLKQLLYIRHYFYWQGVRYDYDKPAGQKLYAQVKNEPGVALLVDTVPTSKFQRLKIFTDDNNTANARVSSLDSSFERIFLPNNVFKGQAYATAISIDRKYFRADKPADLGRVLIQIKSVSEELYKYLFWYELYKTAVGFIPAGQLFSPPGNIQNGLGIFGGISKWQRAYYFDTLR